MKLEEGDFRGAVRLICSEDSVVDVSDATISALRSKHPTSYPGSILPPPPSLEEVSGAFSICEGDVAKAIRSFSRASAGSPDGLRAWQLLDLISPSAAQWSKPSSCSH